MSALEDGAKRGHEYVRRYSVDELKETTFEQYCAIGRFDARFRYSQKKAQDDYVLGWWRKGQEFLTLFKPADEEMMVAEKQLAQIHRTLDKALSDLQLLLAWRTDDISLQEHLHEAKESIVDALVEIVDTLHYLNLHNK